MLQNALSKMHHKGRKKTQQNKETKDGKKKKSWFLSLHLSQLWKVWSWTSPCILTFAHFCSFQHLEIFSGEGRLSLNLWRAGDQQFGEATSQEHIDPVSKRPESAVRLHGAVDGAAFRGAVGQVEVWPLRGAGWGFGVEHSGQVDLPVEHKTHVWRKETYERATEDLTDFFKNVRAPRRLQLYSYLECFFSSYTASICLWWCFFCLHYRGAVIHSVRCVLVFLFRLQSKRESRHRVKVWNRK